MTPAEALRLIRERNGLSPVEFADRVGVAPDTIRRAERSDVSAKLAEAVRRVFWVSPLRLADPAPDDVLHLTYLRPLGALP